MTPESAEKLPQSRVSWNYFIFNCVYVGESVHLIAVVLGGDIGGPETVVKMVVSCPVCGCWDLIPSPLEEQQMLLHIGPALWSSQNFQTAGYNT